MKYFRDGMSNYLSHLTVLIFQCCLVFQKPVDYQLIFQFLFFRKPVDYQSASQKYAEREEKPTSTSMQSKSFKFLKDTLDSGQGNICLQISNINSLHFSILVKTTVGWNLKNSTLGHLKKKSGSQTMDFKKRAR